MAMFLFQYQEGSGKITAIYCYRKPHVSCHFLYVAFMTSENRMYVNKLPFINETYTFAVGVPFHRSF